jgi:hypothetical protein
MLDNYKNPISFAPDMDYFKIYPAPMFEAMFNQHIGPCNSTTPYYGPLLYWLCRAVNALNVMEIGMAQGWSSFFMASAVKDTGVRNGVEGMYYGVEISDCTELFDRMKARGVNAKHIHKDSLKLIPADWDNKFLDVVYQDGWHSTEYVLDELAILAPYLKDNGNGYWVMHDVYSWCEEGFAEVKKRHPNWECVRFLTNYGLAIFRNMDNYDYKKKYWDGPQKPAYPNREEIVT